MHKPIKDRPLKIFNTCPLLISFLAPTPTIKAVLLIHWQAVKLFMKRTEYVPKPMQNASKITLAHTHKEEL